METLIALSLKYSNEENSNLIYWLDKSGSQKCISSTLLNNAQISNRLILISDKAILCIPYLINIHSNFIKTSINGYIDFDKIKIKNRTVTKKRKTIRRFYNRRVVTLGFAILQAIILDHPKNRSYNICIKNMVLPLKLTDDDHNLKVDFLYSNGSRGTFYIDKQYKQFLSNIEEYAELRQCKIKTALHYLFPLGSEREPLQWQGLAPDLRHLEDYGIRAGQFFVSLGSSRFRETAAKIARRKVNSTEWHVSQILNNQYRTVLKHYSEGNHYDNQLIISQGLKVVQKMGQGFSLEQSKSKVAAELNIPVIKYEELIGSDAYLNGIGIGCFDNSNNNDEVCIDYEKCVKCRYAKLVNDVESLYRLFSFLECMEESWIYYPERFSKNLGKSIELYKNLILKNISPEIIKRANFKLDSEGRHFLWDNLELSSLGYKGV